MDTSSLETKERRLEESFGASESLVTNGDDLTVRKLVRLFKLRRLGRSLELLLKVESDVTKLLLNVSNDFSLGRSGEEVTTLHENLNEVVGKVSTSKIDTEDSVGKGETFVNGDSVGDTVTRVKNDTGGSAGSVKRENGLDRDVEGRGIESLEHDLGHLLSVLLGVKRSLSEEDGVLLRSDTELIVEGMVPDLLHVVPVCDDTVLNGVLQGKNTSLRLSFVTEVG